LYKKARLSSRLDDNIGVRQVAELAVDGNTDGTMYHIAHSAFESMPWWEVDLGSEQAINRIVVWHRTEGDLYKRMNHFRIRVLDSSRKVVFEQVIDKAPTPSAEIVPQALLAGPEKGSDPLKSKGQTPFPTKGDKQPLIVRLPRHSLKDVPPRYRVSVATRL